MKYLTFNNIIRAEIKLKDTEGHFSHIWTKFFDHYLILKKVFYSIYDRVVKLQHKFMLASYMKQIAKFLALLHHNASFFNFCIII